MNGSNVDLPLPRVPGITESIPRNDKALEKLPDTLPLDIVTKVSVEKAQPAVEVEGSAVETAWKDLSVEERAKINMRRFDSELPATNMGTATREVTPVDPRIVQLNEARKKQSGTS